MITIKFTMFAIAAALAAGPALAADKTIHPEADRILRETSARLSEAKAFTFKAELWEDVSVAGHKVTTTKTVEVRLRRPNGVQVEVRSPTRSRGFWYDGHSLTLLNRLANLYGTIPVPGTIDEVLDAASDKFGINLPLEDLLVSDPYASAMEGIKGGAYFGKVNILGTPCQHIAFSTDTIDWQLWISDDAEGLPKKLVITYKLEPAAPQVTAVFTNWNLKSSFTDDTFVFSPPAEAGKIEVLPATDSE